MQGKAAAGGEAIERGAGGTTRSREIVFTLIEKNAGLLAMQQVGLQTEAVHVNGHRLFEVAAKKFDFARQLLEGAHGGIVTGDDGPRPELLLERCEDFRQCAVHALIERLN